MMGFFDDLRYGLRGLVKHRGFALAAVLSLALGIGANTTIFTLLNAIFLRPLPVRDPGRLAAVFTTGGFLACCCFPTRTTRTTGITTPSSLPCSCTPR